MTGGSKAQWLREVRNLVEAKRPELVRRVDQLALELEAAERELDAARQIVELIDGTASSVSEVRAMARAEAMHALQ